MDELLAIGPVEGVSVVVPVGDISALASAFLLSKDPRRRTLALRIENQHSTWLSHEAWVGVKWKTKRGWRSSARQRRSFRCRPTLSTAR
jgi:hypothetical protein